MSSEIDLPSVHGVLQEWQPVLDPLVVRYERDRETRYKTAVNKTRDNPQVYPPKYFLTLTYPIVARSLGDLSNEIKNHFSLDPGISGHPLNNNEDNVWQINRIIDIENEKRRVNIILTGGNTPQEAKKTSIFVEKMETYLEIDETGVRTRIKGVEDSELPANGHDEIFWRGIAISFLCRGEEK